MKKRIVTIYHSRDGWRSVLKRGRTLFTSSESYTKRAHCLKMAMENLVWDIIYVFTRDGEWAEKYQRDTSGRVVKYQYRDGGWWFAK